MGLFDFLFSSNQTSNTKERKVQDPTQRKFLENLANQPLDIPDRTVAGLTPVELQGQQQLAKFVSGGDFQDPATSKTYQSFRAQSLADEERAASALRRRQQLGGNLMSTASARTEGDLRNQFGMGRSSLLAQLFEAERGRSNALTQAQAAAQLGPLERMVNQQQSDVNYQNQLADLLAPYQYQAPISGTLLDLGKDTTNKTTQNQSLWDSINTLAGAAGSVIGGIGGIFGGGGVPAVGQNLPIGIAPAAQVNPYAAPQFSVNPGGQIGYSGSWYNPYR